MGDQCPGVTSPGSVETPILVCKCSARFADVRSSGEVVSEAGGPNYQLQCSNISEPTISLPPMPQTVIFWPFDRLRAFSGTSGSQ